MIYKSDRNEALHQSNQLQFLTTLALVSGVRSRSDSYYLLLFTNL